MSLIVQLIVMLIVCAIVLGVARAMPVTTDPWIRWGIYALAAVLVCAWLLGAVGVMGPVPWRARW